MISPSVKDKQINNLNTVNSLQDHLKIIEPDLLNKLVSTKNWQSIEKIAAIFPSAITNFFGFEYRLANNHAPTDFLLCASADEAGQKVLGDRNYSIQLPEFLATQIGWKNLFDFSTVWNQPDSVLNQVTNVWLEFDVGDPVDAIPIPSLFFGLNPDTKDYQWVTQAALPTLLNRPLTQPLLNCLDRCFASLPPTAHVFQIGLMLARDTDAVRVCIRNLQPQNIREFLTAMDWQGDLHQLAPTLDALAGLVDRIDLDIDVGKTIYPKIGLECYLNMQPALQPKWQVFLKYLVDMGLCTLAKQDRLLGYPGYVRQRDRPKLWADNLCKLEQFLGSQFETVFFRGLHHIKLSYNNDSITEAKAYLYVSHSQIDYAQFQSLKNARI